MVKQQSLCTIEWELHAANRDSLELSFSTNFIIKSSHMTCIWIYISMTYPLWQCLHNEWFWFLDLSRQVKKNNEKQNLEKKKCCKWPTFILPQSEINWHRHIFFSHLSYACGFPKRGEKSKIKLIQKDLNNLFLTNKCSVI